MATRIVEGKKPYTGGKAIEITEDKVINLRLRSENNLIIYDSGDNEIYVDLQLPDELRPTDAFPVGITTGRAVVDNGWDKEGTIVCFKTTSGDNIKLYYTDEGKVYIDNGTGTFKQIYLKGEVDTLLQNLQSYVEQTFQEKLIAGDGIGINDNTVTNTKPGPTVSASAPSNPTEGMLWYDTTNDILWVYNGTQWDSGGGGGGGSGDVIGPSNSIDGNLAVFDGTTGKIIKDGGAVPVVPTNISAFINDSGYVTDSIISDTAYANTWDADTTHAPTKNAVYDKISAMDTTISGKQDALGTQPAYTTQGTATKVPTITTNTLGQVTAITETNITFPVTSVNNNTGAVTVSEFNPGGTATTGYVVTKTANGYEWAAPSGGGGDVLVSSQANNILTSGMKIWAGSSTDYGNLGTYDSNCIYLTIE